MIQLFDRKSFFFGGIFSYKTFINTFFSVTYAFVIALLFQSLIYQPFKIPSGSMQPGLEIGDYLFVEKFAYGYNNSSLSFMLNRMKLFNKSFFFNNPQRGDVIVFLLPTDRSLHYIKRLIGLPGDKIQIKEGILYINSIAVKNEYISQKIAMSNTYSIPNDIKVFKEVLPNGVSYRIYKNRNKQMMFYNFDYNNTPLYKVPQNHYFFMGDNRGNSIDSRFLNSVGYVHQSNIVGKAKLLFWTSDFSVKSLMTELKTNRTFKQIK